MSRYLIGSLSFLLLINIFACISPNKSDALVEAEAAAEEATAMAAADLENKQLDVSIQQRHIQHMEAWLATYKQRKNAKEIVSFPVKLTGITNAEANFYEGQIQTVRWNDSEAGMNALRTFMFEDKRIIFSTINDHGNNWYRVNYTYPEPGIGCVAYITMGDFSDGDETAAISLDEKVVKFSCNYPAQYLAQKIYQTAIQQHGNRVRFYRGQIGKELSVYLKWERDGENLKGAYHYIGKPAEISLNGYLVGDSIRLFESHEGEITGSFAGTLKEDETIEGFWLNTDQSKKLPFQLQRQRLYLGPNGEKTYQQIFDRPAPNYVLIDDKELPADYAALLKKNYSFTSTSAVATGDNDFRSMFDYFRYAMTNTIVPDEITIDDDHPDATFNYFYFINLHQPDFVSEKERNDGYYSDLSSGFDINNQLMAYLIKHIDRSPQTLERLFKDYGSTIYEWIPDQLYEKMQVGENLEELLASYDTIATYTEFESRLSQVYSSLDSLDEARLSKPKGTYGRIEYMEREACFKPFFNEQGNASHIPKLDFWARRQHEGNVRTVARILREIKSGYENGMGADEGD